MMSGNHNRESHDSIRILAIECETLLQSLTDIGAQTEAKGLFEDYLQRLSTWAAYLGVFARPSQCLDHRLSNAIDIKDLVLRGLDSLGRSLTSISQNKYQFASTDIDERQASLYSNEDDLLEVEDALEQLFRLATAIKRSSRKTIEQRASEFSQIVELKPINRLFKRTIECLYPKIDQSLQDLLSTSMSDRFAKIMFLGNRQAILAARHLEQRSLPIISEERQSIAVLGPDLGSLKKPILNYGPSVQTRNRSLAPPTSLSPSKVRQHLKAGVPNLDLHNTTSIAMHRSSYPPPPKPQRQEPRLCEWCGEPLNSRHMDPSYWRQHVDNDLKPYICLAEHCTIALGYPSFREWSSHMQQHNEFWYRTAYSPATYVCPLCINNTSPFDKRDELLQHLTSEHQSDSFDRGQLSMIAGQSQGIKERPNDECLLCGLVVKNESQNYVPSKRQSESRSEGNTKKRKTKRHQFNATEIFSSSEDEEDQSPKANNHESMNRHIAAHLQTLNVTDIASHCDAKGPGFRRGRCS
ncbi:hypothetical protein QWA68_012334 [Fusarium oxysporum]|nr:hypothetical protein QWA68_012334 [Fusarium oxysporum]